MKRRSTGRSKSARPIGAVLALTCVVALALAASPTALAKERGRPGAPSAQQANLDGFFALFRSPLRYVSWSD